MIIQGAAGSGKTSVYIRLIYDCLARSRGAILLVPEIALTPQLLQSMEVLQMNTQELLEYLGRVTEENPILEQEDASSLRDAYEELRQKASWLDGGVYGATFAHGESAYPERGVVDRETESLSAFLCDQLDRRHLPKPLLALTRYLAELVDEDGWLNQEDLDGLLDLKIPDTMIQQALAAVQSLDPAGVGARSLSECLLLQLARRGDASPAVMDIVTRFLPELGRSHFPGAGADCRRNSGRRKSDLLTGAASGAGLSARRADGVCTS